MMRSLHRIPLFLLLLLANTWSVGGQTAAFNGAVNTQVSAARRVAPHLGVDIVEIGSGNSVYSFNAQTQRIVASNTKLFTTATALDRLGPGFFFETGVEIRGDVQHGVLRGDLAIIGGGDPNLSGRQYNGDSFGAFREWASALRKLGIESIAGDLVLVRGLFDDRLVHPDWPVDQLTRWYEAPVSALSFNDNCVLVKVEPGAAPGRPARVKTVPSLPIFRISSSAGTTSRTKGAGLSIGRKTNSGEENVLTVSGNIYRKTEKIDKWVAVADPVAYFGAAFRQALAEENITILGRTHSNALLPGTGWRRVHTHRTDLLTALEVINKRSQNLYAETVLKVLGARLCGGGSWERGTAAVREFLTEIGLDSNTYRLADGSGMSRNNRFTPKHITHLLRHMFLHPRGTEFIQTLPFSGELDLSWEKRLSRAPYRGNVLAKTGTLNGVSALSGYAKAASGKVYAFSILCNSTRSSSRAKTAQDRIVKAIIDHG
jgi:D-alanyl-D-alanine carboxypeptidase/D-alanyl-D-alanine-endopeptidase (penicillin-binding protein 4)